MRLMSIDQLVKSFPLSIPGAKYIDRYYMRGSSTAVVHIRQIHKLYDMNDEIYEKMKEYDPIVADKMKTTSKRQFELQNIEKMRRVQADIYDIASFIIDRYGLTRLYAEGVSSEFSYLFSLYEKHPPTEEEMLDCAYLRLLTEKKIKVQPAESLHLNSRAAVSNGLRSNNPQAIFDDREREALSQISLQEQDLAILIYGGAHDFLPDVKKWNRHNKKKFSLIEITPESYGENRNSFDRFYKKLR